MELSIARLQLTQPNKAETRLLEFHVFDGASRIVIEANSEEDAIYLCNEMGWELICACDA